MPKNRIVYLCFTVLIIQQLVLICNCQDVVLCTDSYCQDKTCPTISDKCKTNGKILLSPETCNCCSYCLEYIDEGGSCSSGSQSGVTASKYCGPGLYCNKKTQTCIKFTDMEEGDVPVCSQKQREYDDKRKNGELGMMELRPNCDRNGLFEPYHCIPGQICYCVDKYGERIPGEVDFTSTPEYTLKCPCSRGIREAEAILGITANPVQHFRCNSNGDYDTIQCLNEENCFCVDADDGTPTFPNLKPVSITNITHETMPCINEDQDELMRSYYKTCEESYLGMLNEIEEYKKDGYEMFFSYSFPSCELDGTYALIQEDKTSKYCSNPDGTPINNNDKTYTIDVTDPKASEMNCKCAKAVSIMSSLEKPNCDDLGNYEKMQCRRGKCYCVDENGNQIKKEVDQADQSDLKCN